MSEYSRYIATSLPDCARVSSRYALLLALVSWLSLESSQHGPCLDPGPGPRHLKNYLQHVNSIFIVLYLRCFETEAVTKKIQVKIKLKTEEGKR